MIALRGLRHAYNGRTVLDVPQWDVEQGEATLVLGASGSGKSTLLAAISGLIRPSEGSVQVAGKDFSSLSAAGRDAFRARHVGLVLQTLHLIGVLTVRDNLRLARRLAGLAPDDNAVQALLVRLGVESLSGRKARELSTGEMQRVAIARAMVNLPRVILADEPTSALDDANCAQAIDLLLAQARTCGATLVVATHDHRIRERFTRTLQL